jgi:ribose transport system permease protein
MTALMQSAVGGRLAGYFARYGSILVTVLVIVYIEITNPTFLSSGQVNNLMATSAPLAVLAAGVTIMLSIAEFDLSFAANMTFGATVCARLLNHSVPGLICVLVALCLCALVGAVNGFMVTQFGMSAFITTLASSGVLTGLAYVVGGYNEVAVPSSFGAWTYRSTAGVPWIFVVGVLVLGATWVLLERMVWGRNAYAVGGNSEAARLRGVPIGQVRFTAFLVMGALSGVASVCLLGSMGNVSVGQFPANYLLNGLACVFLGTAALRPGQVHVLGTSIGVVLITVLVSGMTFTNIAYQDQSLVIGGVLLLAVCFSRFAGLENRSRLRRHPADADNALADVAA